MLHEPAVVIGKDNSIAKKTKLGVILFFAYLIIYSGFVFIGIAYPELMGLDITDGINLAFYYGMGLIVLAIIMGLIYNHICTGYENKYNKEEKL